MFQETGDAGSLLQRAKDLKADPGPGTANSPDEALAR
jgi:hypothetical protein